MAFSDKPHYILMFMISSTLVLFATALDVSTFATFPGEKHVVIYNVVPNRQLLYAHCKSSEIDFGMIQIHGILDFLLTFR
ncbi:hypothetical protein V5N11_034262 [Cardamine amara subsp. amara]|uniref:S-protein homolog n=1 Tax=Cardamine amara subsp. amara TaxID=228776 RepID=A0ABD1AX30_CARAN